MRKFQFDRSPVVLAVASGAGLAAGGAVFAKIVMGSMFRGGYLEVLPYAAFMFGVAFLMTWMFISFVAKDLSVAAKNIRLLREVAKVFGRAQATTIVKFYGMHQALVFARLVKSGRWRFNSNLLPGQTLSSELSGKGVTDEDLADLAELRTVTWLNLAGAPVTDAGVVRLTHLSVLQVVVLSGTKVTDNCLFQLRELPELRKLDIDETKVTDAGLRSTGLLDKKFSLREFEQKWKAEGTGKIPPMPPVGAKPFLRAVGLFKQHKYAQAEARAREAVAAVEAFGADNVWLGLALLQLAICQDAQGKFAEVEPTCQRALEIMEKALGPVDMRVERILWNLGRSQRVQGKFVPAESSLKRSLAIAEKHSRDTAAHHAELALVYLASGRLEAQAQFRSAVDKFDTALQPEGDRLTPAAFNPTVLRANYVTFLREFAALLRKRGQDDKAKKLESQAETIQSRLK